MQCDFNLLTQRERERERERERRGGFNKITQRMHGGKNGRRNLLPPLLPLLMLHTSLLPDAI